VPSVQEPHRALVRFARLPSSSFGEDAVCEVHGLFLGFKGRGRARQPNREEVGIETKKADDGRLIVQAVHHGLAERTAQVAPGLVVLAIDGKEPSANGGELAGVLAEGATKVVTFGRPRPPISLHGRARKGLHKKPPFKMHPKQLKWLEENAFNGGRSQLRPKTAWVGMKAKFSRQLRLDTMTPMWLEKDQISDWLARQAKEEKERRKEAQKKAEAGPKSRNTTTPEIERQIAKKRPGPATQRPKGSTKRPKETEKEKKRPAPPLPRIPKKTTKGRI